MHFGGDELADVLAQSRGLGLGLILAHQYLDQLPANLLNAVLGTVRTQLVFQMAYTDASKTAKQFLPLTTEDLLSLDAYEIALRPCVNARTLPPVTGVTTPLPKRLRDPSHLAEYSRYRHGVPRADVDAARAARIRTDNNPPIQLGRER